MVDPHSYRNEHSQTHTTSEDYGDYYRQVSAKKIHIQPPLLKLIKFIDGNRLTMVEDLMEAVQIKSISSELKYNGEIMRMVKLVEKWMVRLGAAYECYSIGFHEVAGKKVRLPPVILATCKAGPGKKTVCVYAHIDVNKPVEKNWDSDPWTLDERDKVFYGNGVILGKGPLFSWFYAMLAFRETGVELPVNVKFIIEAMHHQRCEGLKEFLMCQKQIFLNAIDYIVVCDSEWLGQKYPCLTYGCVGILHFTVTITKSGDSKSDPKEDMKRLFEKIAKGDQILVPHFNKHVTSITPDEEQLIDGIVFDMEECRKKLPPERQTWSKSRFLMHYWRKPTVYVDDIQECICDKKDMTKVKRHFVAKIVPRQNAEECIANVEYHVNSLPKELGIENAVEIESNFETRPWLEDTATTNYEAARRATIQIYKEDPNMIRDDKDMKCINILQLAEKNILLLPLGVRGGNGGGDNEHVPVRNFFEGIKLLCAYLFQIELLTKRAK